MENSKLQILYEFGFAMVEEEIVDHNILNLRQRKSYQFGSKLLCYVIGKLK